MKQNKFIRECGPFEVHSISQDGEGVRLQVFPAFPKYNLSPKRQAENDIDPGWKDEPRWAIHRARGDGGGPGIFTAIALAKEFERFLNQPYSEDEVKAWHKTLAEALKKVRAKAQRQMNRAMSRLEKK